LGVVPMKTEITCLVCGGRDFKLTHQCAVATTRGRLLPPLCRGVHKDFCKQCEGVLKKHFLKMLATKT
jgi:hypothetical protein